MAKKKVICLILCISLFFNGCSSGLSPREKVLLIEDFSKAVPYIYNNLINNYYLNLTTTMEITPKGSIIYESADFLKNLYEFDSYCFDYLVNKVVDSNYQPPDDTDYEYIPDYPEMYRRLFAYDEEEVKKLVTVKVFDAITGEIVEKALWLNSKLQFVKFDYAIDENSIVVSLSDDKFIVRLRLSSEMKNDFAIPSIKYGDNINSEITNKINLWLNGEKYLWLEFDDDTTDEIGFVSAYVWLGNYRNPRFLLDKRLHKDNILTTENNIGIIE